MRARVAILMASLSPFYEPRKRKQKPNPEQEHHPQNPKKYVKSPSEAQMLGAHSACVAFYELNSFATPKKLGVCSAICGAAQPPNTGPQQTHYYFTKSES